MAEMLISFVQATARDLLLRPLGLEDEQIVQVWWVGCLCGASVGGWVELCDCVLDGCWWWGCMRSLIYAGGKGHQHPCHQHASPSHSHCLSLVPQMSAGAASGAYASWQLPAQDFRLPAAGGAGG